MKKVRVGVLGGYRGTSMINYCKRADNAEIVAICDKSREVLEAQRENAEGLNLTLYDNFDGRVFSSFIELIEPAPFVYLASGVLLVLGMVVGMFGSWVAVRKHLKI